MYSDLVLFKINLMSGLVRFEIDPVLLGVIWISFWNQTEPSLGLFPVDLPV